MGPFLMPLEFLQSSLIFPMRPGLSPLRASLLSEALKEELRAMRGGGELLHGHSLPGDPLPLVSFDFGGIFFFCKFRKVSSKSSLAGFIGLHWQPAVLGMPAGSFIASCYEGSGDALGWWERRGPARAPGLAPAHGVGLEMWRFFFLFASPAASGKGSK